MDVWRPFARTQRELAGMRDWLLEDPKVEESLPGGGTFTVHRLFSTSAGAITVNGSGITAWITRYDNDGWARADAWTGRPTRDGLIGAIEAVGVSDDEAARISADVEPLLAARRPPARQRRRYRLSTVKLAVTYVVPWSVGLAFLLMTAARLFRCARRR